MRENYYKILGIRKKASLEEIRSAYRRLARRFHPDKNVVEGETELFLDVQRAYEILSDPEKRAEYNTTIPDEVDEILPIKISTIYSRKSLTRIDEPQLLYVLLDIIPQLINGRENSTPLNICLVIDVSTSMQGHVLDTVKTTSIKLFRELSDRDILSIVTFSDYANVIIPAGRTWNRKDVELKIQMLSTSGGTEIYQGLEKGYEEINRYRNENFINHLLLLTDGRTYGDEQDCIQLARMASDQGIGISALGIGNKWNDSFMDELTAITGGNSIFVENPSDILYFLTEKFKGFNNSFAQNVSLDFIPEEGVELKYAYRLQPDAAPILVDSPISLGSIPNNSSLKIIFEFMVNDIADEVEDKHLLEGTIFADIPSITNPRSSIKINFDRPTEIEYDMDLPPQIIVDAMSNLTLYRMQERARKDISEGATEKASRRLQQLATQLLARGEIELAKSILEEVSGVQQNYQLSESGKKGIKYGTRNLLLPDNPEE